MTRKSFCFVLAACLVLACCGGSRAAETVTLSATEWQTLTAEWSNLEQGLSERGRLVAALEKQSFGLSAASKDLTRQVADLRQEVTTLRTLRQEQEQALNETEQALQEAERSLMQLKQDARREMKSEERHKRAWQVVALAAVVWAASR